MPRCRKEDRPEGVRVVLRVVSHDRSFGPPCEAEQTTTRSGPLRQGVLDPAVRQLERRARNRNGGAVLNGARKDGSPAYNLGRSFVVRCFICEEGFPRPSPVVAVGTSYKGAEQGG